MEVIHGDFWFEPSTGRYDNPGSKCDGRFVSKPFQTSGVLDFYTKVETSLNIL